MKTATKSYIGEVVILNHRLRVQYGQPTNNEGKGVAAEKVGDEITFRETLCGRAIVNHAAGLASFLLFNSFSGTDKAQWRMN